LREWRKSVAAPVTNAVLVPIFLLEIGFQGLAILEVIL
jgi:hypothetical protein